MRKQFKRDLALWLMGVFLICCLAGCSGDTKKNSSGETTDDGSCKIYYTDLDKTYLVTKTFYPNSEDFEGMKAEILEAFQKPSSTDVLSALPEGVKINSTVTGINEIDVDFSAEYLSLDTISELLLRSALVRTLLQLPGVDTVRFTVESQPLKIGDEEIGPMTEDTFIVPTEDSINSYRNAELTLYFPLAKGKLLKRESRKVYYSSNVNTERLVIEEMLKTPKDTDILPVAVEGTLVSDITVNNGVCTVDFSEEINNAPPSENVTDPETVLYAFANSLIDSCQDDSITGVRFKVGGSSEVRFRDQVNLDQVFSRNADLIEGAQEETQAKEEQIAAEEAPAEEAPAEEAPAEGAPAEEAPAEEAPAEEAPAEEAPAAEAPAEEVPAAEASAEGAPAEEAPAEEAPA